MNRKGKVFWYNTIFWIFVVMVVIAGYMLINSTITKNHIKELKDELNKTNISINPDTGVPIISIPVNTTNTTNINNISKPKPVPTPVPKPVSNVTYKYILYPNPKYTTGDILTREKNVICRAGYSAQVRDVPASVRKQVFANYEIPFPQPLRSTELDHMISLELGGSNDISNLWIEPSDSIVGKGRGFESKDKIENYLHEQVCSGKMTIDEAQTVIRTKWYDIYLQQYG